jgi:acetolactate synthase-1/2/3 large subunit
VALWRYGFHPGQQRHRTADVILAIGCRFSDRVTSSYRPGVTFTIPVQTGPDRHRQFEIGRNYPSVGIVGDAKTTLQALAGALADRSRSTTAHRIFAELPQDLKAQWDEPASCAPLTTCDD